METWMIQGADMDYDWNCCQSNCLSLGPLRIRGHILALTERVYVMTWMQAHSLHKFCTFSRGHSRNRREEA